MNTQPIAPPAYKARLLGLLLVASLIGSGCARNVYTVFYRDQTGVRDPLQLPGYVPPEGQLQIFSSDDLSRDVREARRRGYEVLGASSFNGPPVRNSDKGLRKHGAAIGAQAVLVTTRYARTETAYAPFMLPTSSTSNTNMQATAYGSGGFSSAYGTATTQTRGTVSVPVPYAVTINDVNAVFLAKVKRRVGLLLAPLSEEIKKSLGSNRGAVVDLVMEGSTGYRADIFPGDIVLSVAGQDFYSGDEYNKILAANEGHTVEFKLLRDGKPITKRALVEPLPPKPAKRGA